MKDKDPAILIRIPQAVREALKLRAAEDGKSVQQFVAELIAKSLKA